MSAWLLASARFSPSDPVAWFGAVWRGFEVLEQDRSHKICKHSISLASVGNALVPQTLTSLPPGLLARWKLLPDICLLVQKPYEMRENCSTLPPAHHAASPGSRWLQAAANKTSPGRLVRDPGPTVPRPFRVRAGCPGAVGRYIAGGNSPWPPRAPGVAPRGCSGSDTHC